jgi:hypothetical protein
MSTAKRSKKRELAVRRELKIGDSYYGEWRERLKLDTTYEQDWACLRLELMGKKFLVDYGYENAEDILRAR